MDNRLSIAQKIVGRDRAEWLIILIDDSIKKAALSLPLSKITEENCIWYTKGFCGIDAPDSIMECHKSCAYFKEKKI